MKRVFLKILQSALLLGLPAAGFAQSIELQAIADFTNRESGAVPYYLEIANGRNALAINAANPDYREKFARAEHEFIGPDGIYDITINALGEIDGEGTYRLSINGIVQGVSVNPPVAEDYTVIPHLFRGIALTSPTIIAVESNAVSNDTIPEGDGFAFARGRWRSVVLEDHELNNQAANNAVDLGISLSTVDSLLRLGGSAPFIVSVINMSDTVTATAPEVEISLPDNIRFSSSDGCTAFAATVRCSLPELPPGEVATVSITADILVAGWLNISAFVGSDQADSDRANNVTNLSFESMAPATDVDSGSTSGGTDTGGNSETGGNVTGGTGNTDAGGEGSDTGDSGGGANTNTGSNGTDTGGSGNTTMSSADGGDTAANISQETSNHNANDMANSSSGASGFPAAFVLLLAALVRLRLFSALRR